MRPSRAFPLTAFVAAFVGATAAPAAAQDTTAVRTVGDSVSVRFVDADLRAVVQALGNFLDKPVLFAAVPGARVTLVTPHPVARAELPRLLRGLVEAQNPPLELVSDSGYYRVQQRPAPQPAFGTSPGGASSSQAAPAAQPVLTVIRLSHARAEDVAATLSALYGSGGSDLGGARPGTLSEELRRNAVPPFGPAAQPSVAGPTASPAAPGHLSAVLEGAVTIVPDPTTNSLLIRATPRDADLLRQAVADLDIRPLQVLIEVVIVEARRDLQTSWGLGLTLPATRAGPGNTTVSATQQGGGLGDFVLNVMNIGHANVNAVLQAGESRGDVQILSRPVLLAANNERAQMTVGSQRPFVQVSRTLPTDAATRDQVVEYRNVGTTLTIRPTISADGYVTLEVTQEVDAATSETAFDAPVISTREFTTQVLVKDSQTIVLGGLVDHQNNLTSGGVPLLSRLPLLGGLFGSRGNQTNNTELFVFLTPRVLRTDEDMHGATERYRQQASPIH